ncbi:hypothetical protein VTL71DRAFT_8873 [Oculimacula yallundae]|uniref:MobA-like NTP transferase domain-containing protein n=1 Tax=Oculimacula yallundae TaxID=86028 RepID=A0ABR4BT53_9HELO
MMEFEAGGPILKPLLIIGGASSRMGTCKELLRFPDGRTSLEHAIETLRSAVPSAGTIYVSLHDQSQIPGIQTILDSLRVKRESYVASKEHHHDAFPTVELLFNNQEKAIGPAAGLLAAHDKYKDFKWLVLGCDYPLLPPPALQQLILEYQDPITCFENESGFSEPLIAIWGPEALLALENNVSNGAYGLNRVVEEISGKLVKPLRDEWITGTNTMEEWNEAMKVVTSQVRAW